MTLGVLRGLRELGLTTPHDLALTCFDDFDWADLVTPGPTAMRQQIDRMGHRSVEMLLARMREPGRPYVVESIPPVFKIRESCGCDSGVPQPVNRIPMTQLRRADGHSEEPAQRSGPSP